MLEQLVMRLEEKPWVLMLLLMAAVALAACGPKPTPEVIKKVVKETVVVEKEVVVTKVVEKVVELEEVELELADVIKGPVPVEVENRQPLQLDVVEKEIGRLHFRLEIDADDYPDGRDFKLEVMAIPREKIADICQGQEGCDEYPEVSGVTEGGRLIIGVDSGQYAGKEYVAASPYAFSVTGIDEFASPVSVSISVDKPEEIPPEQWEKQDHGLIIHHENDETTERFPVDLILDDGGFYRVINSDSTRCCRAHADCSSEPACLKCE